MENRSGQSEIFTTLMFWFSFQPWALAWGVLLQVCLQTCLLTLFQRLCFRRTLCFYGMWRRLFPDASRFSPSLLDGSRLSFLFGHCRNFRIPDAGVSYMISCPSPSA